MGSIRKEISNLVESTGNVWNRAKGNLLKYAAISIMALPLSCGSCKPDYEPPTAGIDVNPKSGDAPLSVNVKGYGTPGTEEIKAYTLHVDDWKKTKSTPFDTTFILNNVGDHKLYMEVSDLKNQSDATDKVTVTVYQGPYIEQTAALVNDNEIAYSATLSKKSSAELKVKRDGVAFLTLQISDVNASGVDFQKTFKFSPDGITKGNYEFALQADDLQKSNSVQVPNYKPTANLSGLDTELMEGVEKTIALEEERFDDKNPEDNPVSINSATSLDGKTQVTLNGNNLTIKPIDYTGDYQIEIEFGSTAGGLEKAVLTGSITQEPWTYYVNPFVSTNSNGAAYDALTTKAQRDAYLQEKLFEDWADAYHIPPSFPPNPTWDCTQYANQLMINFHGFPGATGYSGFDLDSIYYYFGTLKENGEYGLPVYSVYVSGGVSKHDMNAILTGNDLTKFQDWNFIEPQRDSINVKPGRLYIPETCYIEIRAPPKNREGDQFGIVPIAIFNVVNKIATFEQPYTSTNLKIIKNRE